MTTLDFNTIAAGTALPYLNVSDLQRMQVSVPCLNAQQEIETTLSALDERISLLREINATLESIAQLLFKSWFVDFDPVRSKEKGIQPIGMDEGTAELFPDSFDELSYGAVPDGWTIGHLGEWLDVLETGRRPKGGVAGISDGVPSIGAESIVRIAQFDFGKTKFVPSEYFNSMKTGALQSHDVLLYKDGGKPGVFLPRVSMFGDDFPFKVCGINEHVFRIRAKPPFCQEFLYFWLWSDAIMHELKHRGGKAAIPGINRSDVTEQKILIPTSSVLDRFRELAAPLVSSMFVNAKQIANITELRENLLRPLVSGRLRTPSQKLLSSVPA